MPERPLTVAAYAAGASLAAATLVYVFAPTFFFDDEAANSSKASRKRGVVGLHNPANDCFINSVLQALAGLPQLRLYLIREVHRRALDGPDMYADLTAALEEHRKSNDSKALLEWKALGLQQGLVTIGLKDFLDALNERPIYKKTITAQHFIRVVETSFRTRINRSQQDAQEFLQIIAERLDEENHAGRRARREARRRAGTSSERNKLEQATRTALDEDLLSLERPRDSKMDGEDAPAATVEDEKTVVQVPAQIDAEDDQFIFPFEGKIESQVECSYCSFKPKAHASSFVTLTLHVAQSSGSLNSCFDGMFKLEHIDDFTCDHCRLDHALQVIEKQLSKASLSAEDRAQLVSDQDKIGEALRDNPERPPKDVKLPDLSTAPKRRISRHMRISSFPRILSLHLSRSVWDSGSSKNTAKVTFPETLSLGSLLDRKSYRLLAVVTHKGGHNSGHYETFRRQFLSAPYSTPASMGTEGIYSVRSTPTPSPAPSPHLQGSATVKDLSAVDGAPATPPDRRVSPATLDPPSTSSSLSTQPTQSTALDRRKPTTHNVPLEAMATPGLPPLPEDRLAGGGAPQRPSSLASVANRIKRKQGGPDRWWRISDDKIKECKTADVLNMQREVYLLFYELVPAEDG